VTCRSVAGQSPGGKQKYNSRYRVNNHVCMAITGNSNGRMANSVRSVPRCYKQDSWNKEFFLICIVGCGVQTGPLGTSATYWPIVPAPGDCEDGEFGGMNGRGNRSTRRKPAPAPLFPPQNPTWPEPGLNPGRRVGKPATNCFSYGAA
jgi:hypothetical protein